MARRPAGGKRIAKVVEENRRAMDDMLGKTRYDVLYRPNSTPVRRDELVKLTGYGTGRRMRFHEYVKLADGREYVTVRDTVEGRKTGAFISVRPNQVRRLRKQW